ncbi:hypothetical protein ACFYW1_35465 [Streptomyces sp. NPDC002669]|uniref:hypothetical protein n=1 Tax=Streptomyces sp. NPDC002669 TaxID=3364658 RepID=UPI0036A5787B
MSLPHRPDPEPTKAGEAAPDPHPGARLTATTLGRPRDRIPGTEHARIEVERVAHADPWQFVGSFPTKDACEQEAQNLYRAGKTDHRSCSPSKSGYDLGAHFR